MSERQYVGVQLPVGCEVLVGDSVESLVDVGVIPMETNSKIEITYDRSVVQGSRKEEVVTSIRNMVAKASTALYQIRLDVINRLAGGAMTVENVPGEPVSGKELSIAAGWKDGSLVILPGQNADGSAPAVASVTGSSSGALAADDDYILARDASGAWGVVLKTGGSHSASVTETVTVIYGYTPAASVKATMGSGSAAIQKKVVRFQKIQDGKMFRVTLYSATMSNGITLSFPGADEEKPTSLPVEIEGTLDTSRASGDQLLEIIDEIGVN